MDIMSSSVGGRCLSAVLMLTSFIYLPSDVKATINCNDIDHPISLNSKISEPPQSAIISFIPPSFVILLLEQSATPTRHHQPCAKHPQIATTLHRKEVSLPSPPPSSALNFWTRADSDYNRIDDNLKKRVDRRFLDRDDNEEEDDQIVISTTASKDGAFESDLSSDDNNITNGRSNIEQEVATVSNHSQNSMVKDSSAGKIDIIQVQGIDDISTLDKNKSRSRWERLSSVPGVGAFLPGKPLFMRLIPFKSSEIISKIMHEIPVQKNVSDDVQNDQQEYVDLGRSGANKDNQRKIESIGSEEMQQTSSTESSAKQVVEEKRVEAEDNNKRRRTKKENIKGPVMTKEEFECPVVVRNIHELQSAVLIYKVPLRDIGFRFPAKGIGSDVILGLKKNGESVNATATSETSTSHISSAKEEGTIFLRDDPVIKGPLSSLLTYDVQSLSNPNSDKYQEAIKLLSHHPVLSIIRERVEKKSKPGNRIDEGPDAPHLALVIEGGGMRGAVSAGMAAALSTLDLLDAFDSIHGSSAGAIVGAYLVSRQLCTDVYTDIMPAAGSKFASKRRGMVNFGWDWLESKLTSADEEEDGENDDSTDDDEFCDIIEEDDDISDVGDVNNTTTWACEDDISSVEMAMGRIKPRRTRRWSDPSVSESMQYLLSKWFHNAKTSVAKPLSFGAKTFDFASSMRQYLRKRPGMNLTYILDGVMDETHGLRPFDLSAFRANDKKQPLYVIASAVSNGGKGDMETVAFNSEDGDFFGSFHHDGEPTLNDEAVKWYGRIWSLFKFVPYTLFSAARKALQRRSGNQFSPLMKDAVETEALPPGSTAMYGLDKRYNIRKLQQVQSSPQKKSYDPTGRIEGEGKEGIFPCLEASMLVPAAAGPPIQLLRSKNRHLVEQRNRFPIFRPKKELSRRKEINSHVCCDAFCFEPIPYRSAVEKANATHVLALRSRPDGCIVESRQHMYEKLVAPIYFRKHGLPQVAKLFSTGGSQYRYLEDVMTLNEGLVQGIAMPDSRGIKVPPTQLYAGTDKADSFADMHEWKDAHILPITLPFGTPELPTLSQDKEEVIKGLRNGYAAAYDILAPIADIPFDSKTIPGHKVAQILFPDGDDDVAILNKPVKIKSSYIGEGEEEAKRRSFAAWITRKRDARRKRKNEVESHPNGLLARQLQRRTESFVETDQYVRDDGNTLEYIETEALLAALPGFSGGRLDHIAENLLASKE